MNELQLLPLGIQDFKKLREDNFLYVDKTAIIYELTHSASAVFLSRPRRFGKSLLLSTIRYYFLGRKELFTDLAMENLEKELDNPCNNDSFYGRVDCLLTEMEELIRNFKSTK